MTDTHPPRFPKRIPAPRRLAVRLIGGSLAALFTLAACHKQVTPPLVMAGVLPLTGPIAEYGNYMRRGMELALDDAIASRLVRAGEVELSFEDSEANPSKAVLAFERLLALKRPIAVIPATSGVILALKPLANREHVVLLNASAVSTDIEDADDYVFSVIPDADEEGSFLAREAFGRGRRSIAVIFRNDPSGISFKKAFEKQFVAQGGLIPFVAGHQPGERDFRPYVARVAAVQGLDAVFMASFGPEVAAYVRQADEVGRSMETYAYTTFNSSKVLELAGSAANGVIFSSPEFDPVRPLLAVEELRLKLLRKYGGGAPNYYVAAHYDAAAMVLQGIAKGHRDGASLRGYLSSLSEYSGKSGLMKFSREGAATIPLRLYSVVDGQVKPLG